VKALGTYIFAGGFTIGVSKHFNVLAHFEMKPGLYKKTFQANFPGYEKSYASKSIKLFSTSYYWRSIA
jgi:hypothetical protein